MYCTLDAGIDDGFALCMALELSRNYGKTVKLITTTFGNTNIENVNINVAKCREGNYVNLYSMLT